ncbi:hypothetical protein MNBD_ALPHA01-1922 [hydrothermal vent metagenome]|uniref:AdoMet activation domain-containing protein n=1 Tax=hydrothermal vent metagenome TaxID=652676 RepID=A0A3B0RLZ7_9ZZZZ
MPVLNNLPLGLTFDEVIKYHGLRCRGLIRPGTVDLLQSIIDDMESGSYLKPEIAYSIIPLDQIKDGHLHLANHNALPAPIAAHRLKKASHILIGVCTLGHQIGRIISQSFHNRKKLYAILMEELANHALFKLSGLLQKQAERDAADLGLTASGRLSPGDEGFGLSSQTQIVEMAGALAIDIDVNGAQMMSPRHSISMIFGLGRNMPKWTEAQTCENCRSHDRCHHRIAMKGMV